MFAKLGLKLTRVPTPVAGLALGIASISAGLECIIPSHGLIQMGGAAIAFVLISIVLTKFIVFPEILYQDVLHSVTSSILPTTAMGLMVVSKALSILNQAASTGLWIGAVILHLVFLLCFIYFRLRKWDFRQMVPSWFVPPVGIAVAALTAPEVMAREGTVLLYFAMINYTVMLPVILYRFMLYPGIVEAARPTIAIMAAPASLLLAGYITIVPEPSIVLAGILLSVALLMTSTVYVSAFTLLRLPFSPGYASFTFPLAIGATALYKAAEYAGTSPYLHEYTHLLQRLALIETVVATAVILYVIARYTTFYTQDSRKAKARETIGEQRTIIELPQA